MKKIALILAVVMLFSAVSVFAAPSVEHIFYDEVANKYYVFGTYQNSVINNYGEDVPVDTEELGLIVSDGEIEKIFTYDCLDAQNEEGVTKFGMSFGVPNILDTFKVKPYSVNDVKTEYGTEREYDKATDTRKLSDNANLKYVAFSRIEMNNTQFFIYPKFGTSSNDTYTVAGYFRDSNANQTYASVDVKCMTEDPKAKVIDISYATADNKKTTVTIEAEAGNTKTYTFNYSSKSAIANSSNHTYMSEHAGVFYQGENVTTSTSDIRNTFYLSLSSYPLSVDKKSLYIKFPIDATLANQPAIGLTFSGKSASSYGEYNNVEVSIKKATLKDGYKLDVSKTCHQDILDGNIVVGEEVARLGIEKFDNSNVRRYTVDVTDAIKTAYQNGETSIVFELSIDAYDLPEKKANANNICFDIMTNNTNKTRNPLLVY